MQKNWRQHDARHTPPSAATQAAFFALMRHGWIVVVAVLALSLLSGCGEAKDWGADQASLADAIAQAAKGGFE